MRDPCYPAFYALALDLEGRRLRADGERERSLTEAPRVRLAPEERQVGSPATGVPAYAARGFALHPVQWLLALAGIVFLLAAGSVPLARQAPGIVPGVALGPAPPRRVDARVRPPAAPPGGEAATSSGLAYSSEDAMPRAGESPATFPREPRSAGPSLLAQLDAVAARVEALEERRTLAAWCLPACPVGVERVEVRADRISCRCRKAPDLGVYRLSSTNEKARAAEDRGQRVSSSIVDEPGAVALEDGGGAGLSFRGERG